MFRNGDAAGARGLIAKEQTKLSAAHHAARELAGDEGFAAAVDKSFDKAEKSLGSASTGFQPTVAPGAAKPTERKPTDRDAQKQIKENQADSVQLAQ